MTVYRVFEIVSVVIRFYLLLISLRIMLSWFAGGLNISGIHYLARVTDPFLNVFRRLHILRVGSLDFSVLIGLFLLNFLSSLFATFARVQIVSLAITLAVLLQILFNGVGSIISLFAIITFVPVIGLFVRVRAVDALWYRIDGFLQPLLVRFTRALLPRRELPYGSALAIFLTTCVLAGMLLRISLNPLLSLVLRIPI